MSEEGRIMENKKDFGKAVQEYWEDPKTVSIIDANLHKIEIDSVCEHLLSSDHLADIGCGNGEATIEYAKKVKRVTAIERSNQLRAKALESASKAGLANITIQSGDVLEFKNIASFFDAIVTQRLLINLMTWEEQKQAIANITDALKVGGRYIMVENTDQAFQKLNEMRSKVNLSPIPQHWHNKFFDRKKLMSFMDQRFELVKEYDFSLYYFLTRVYSQMFASFQGYGIKAVKDPIFEISDAAARAAYEQFRDSIQFKDSISTIQVFVFKRVR